MGARWLQRFARGGISIRHLEVAAMATKKATIAEPPAAEQEHEHTQEHGKEHEHEPAGRSVPVLVPEMHVRHVPVQVPSVHVPMPGAMRDRLPDVTTNRVLWWGGLAVLAATEVISWPVAGVVAAGTYVAERRAKAAVHEHSADEEHPRHTESQGPGKAGE